MQEIKIMSSTRVEFFRSLRHFMPDHTVSENQTNFSLPTEDGEVQIGLKELPRRQVTGLLSLPQLEVSIDLNGMNETAAEKFLADFDLAFRRGGG